MLLKSKTNKTGQGSNSSLFYLDHQTNTGCGCICLFLEASNKYLLAKSDEQNRVWDSKLAGFLVAIWVRTCTGGME